MQQPLSKSVARQPGADDPPSAHIYQDHAPTILAYLRLRVAPSESVAHETAIRVHGVAVAVGVVGAVPVGLAVTVGVIVPVGVVVVVVVDVGCVVGVAVGADPGTAMIVGNGVTGMLVGRPLSNVGVAVGVGPLFNGRGVVFVPPIMLAAKMMQIKSTTRITPPPMTI